MQYALSLIEKEGSRVSWCPGRDVRTSTECDEIQSGDNYPAFKPKSNIAVFVP